MNLRRDFLLVVTLAATAATPASGQDARAVGPAGGATQGAASIPDFSGIWAHPSFPGFEPPASGPGPVVNKVRRPQISDTDGQILPPNNCTLVSNPAKLVGDVKGYELKCSLGWFTQSASDSRPCRRSQARGAGLRRPLEIVAPSTTGTGQQAADA